MRSSSSFVSGHVGERLVHAGEGGALGILADARRPHGDAHVGAETLVGGEHGRRQVIGNRHRVHEVLSFAGQVGRGRPVPRRAPRPRMATNLSRTPARPRASR